MIRVKDNLYELISKRRPGVVSYFVFAKKKSLRRVLFLFDIYPMGVYHLSERVYVLLFISNKSLGDIRMANNNNSLEEDMECDLCCSGKHKDREEKEYKDLMNRLRRIEGQVRGVEGMLKSGAYCTDILMQVSAITSALNSFNKALLANHMKTCVADNIRNGNDEVIDELVVTLQKLMK